MYLAPRDSILICNQELLEYVIDDMPIINNLVRIDVLNVSILKLLTILGFLEKAFLCSQLIGIYLIEALRTYMTRQYLLLGQKCTNDNG